MENQNTKQCTKRKVHPRQKAGIFSKLFFSWSFPIFYKGLRKQLNEQDLYQTLKEHESTYLGNRLEEAWKEELDNYKHPSLWRALWKVFGNELMLYGIILFFYEVLLKLGQPLALGKLMSYYAPNQTEITRDEAYSYAALIILVAFIQVLAGHGYIFGLQHVGMKCRVACCSVIYRKALRLSKTALVQTTIGQMVNLLSNDVNRFDNAVMYIHNLWSSPLETMIIFYLLYVLIGPTAIVGIGFLLVFIPLQMYLGKVSSICRLKTASRTDERVRLMSEIINGIQVIKMYAWEKSFVKLVEIARKSEITHIRNASYLKALQMSFNMFINRTAIFLCVLTHVLSGYYPTAEYVFVVSSFYGILKQAVTTWFPLGVTAIAEANVSIDRIQTFLKYDETYLSDEYLTPKKKSKTKKMKKKPKYNKKKSLTIHEDEIQKDIGVTMEKACAKWIFNSPEDTLSDIEMKIASNQLVAIVGPVGSGKSSLLHMILKELPITSGKIDVVGNISYASQEPWLFAGSIQQNILFGDSYDPIKYQEVVKVCALERDFSLFPYGDKSIVGDRGVTLSGGQRARINLARAIYKDADIYILDDPLSAVDTHVGKQLFENCISGYLKYKCTILVTHQLQYLTNVDTIFLLENGRIAAQGSFQNILNSGAEFAELFKAEIPIEDDDEEEEKFMKRRKKKSSILVCEDDIQDDEPVIENEAIKKGSISKRVYITYLRAGGNYFMGVFLCIFFVLAQSSASGADYFITYWVNLEQAKMEMETINIYLNEDLFNATLTSPKGPFDIEMNRNNCIIIYATLICSIIFVTITRSLTFFKLCMTASKKLHNNMFSKIVNATMHFFNANPSGRVLNRFSKDMGAIDELLPTAIIDTIQVGLGVLATTIVIASVNPWVLIPTFVILGWFYIFRVIFLASSRNIKRMEGTTRSPVFAHLSASLQGLTTIRAFGAQEILTSEFDHHQNLHSSAFYLFLSCTRSFGFWLDLKCVIYVGFVTLSVLFIGSETYGGNVGLAITQAIGLTGMFQWGMRQWSELENQMTSVERVVEYTEVVKENRDKPTPSPLWPSSGKIEFQNVFLKYTPNAPYVLKNLNFTVQSNEKIGIVGRTGAGKSSLISALFLLSDFEGKILIDGVDTKEIHLESMRSKISIIPQEPVLFSGTLRKNLDPFDEYNDSDLWDALDHVELRKVVSDLPSGLNALISEGGANFSVGQRQLVCLARAIVRNNKILVLDEATANVDPKTDALIQTAIRKNFANCTVLTIAHRLHTIMDSDKVLVMNAGSVHEFGHPYELLRNSKGIFHSLVKETGKNMSENLYNIALENYEAVNDDKSE